LPVAQDLHEKGVKANEKENCEQRSRNGHFPHRCKISMRPLNEPMKARRSSQYTTVKLTQERNTDMKSCSLNCSTDILHQQKRRLPGELRRLLALMITLASAAVASSQALAQPQDYFQTQGKPCISAFGEDRYPQVNFGFDYIALPPVVSPGQQVSVSVQWSFLNPTVPNDIYYLNVFGDWQPATPLATLVSNQLVGGTQTLSNSFTFQAPTTPGNYRIRVPITLAFAPVTNFYGGPANGPYSPGTGPCYGEMGFTVKMPPETDYFTNTASGHVGGGYATFISPFGEEGENDSNIRFDYISVPPVVSPGQQVTATVQWGYLNPANPNAIIYLNVFGDWQPGTELAWLADGILVGGTQKLTNSFTFVAPSTPGTYRIRVPFVEDFGPVTNFYGGPAGGLYNPGTGTFSEVEFTVKVPPETDYFTNTASGQVGGGYANFISPFGEQGQNDSNIRFDYIGVPPVVSPGQQVTATVQWGYLNPANPNAVIYLNVFGDWQPGIELAWLADGITVGGTKTLTNSFTFQAPSTPGTYRIRVPFVEDFGPVTNFYGGPAGGLYNPGTGTFSEITFRVANAWQYNIQSFAGLALYGPPGNYIIEANTNLGSTNWIALATNQVSTTPYFWVDMNSPYYAQRFYLAVPAP
jgi:hypothetical protein